MAEEKCKEQTKHCQERSGLVDLYVLRPEHRLKQFPLAFYMSQGFNLHRIFLVLSSVTVTWQIHPFFFKQGIQSWLEGDEELPCPKGACSSA